MIENHGNFDSRARTVRWNKNLLPNQCCCQVIYLKCHMRNSLHHLGIRRVWIKSHPLDAAWTSFKSGHMNMETRYMSLARTWRLSGNHDMVISPAVPCGRSRRFVALSRMPSHETSGNDRV